MEKKNLEDLPLFGERIAPKGAATESMVGDNAKKQMGFFKKPAPKNPVQKVSSFAEYEAKNANPALPTRVSLSEAEGSSGMLPKSMNVNAANDNATTTAQPQIQSQSQPQARPAQAVQSQPQARPVQQSQPRPIQQAQAQNRPIQPAQTQAKAAFSPTQSAEKPTQKPQRPQRQQGRGNRNGNDLSTMVAKETIKEKPAPPRATKKTPLKIIPLGGLNEIGKNLTVFECGNDMFIVDCGLAFPDSELLGVDIVLPDFTYLEKNADRLRGVVITHGHEDHIGSLCYLLKKINIPVYATRLTIGLIEGKLKEHGLVGRVNLNTVTSRQTIKLGCMAVEFIRVNHSIPDAVALAIHTPTGIVIHTGDFKVDYTPIEGGIIDLARFGELGNRGVLALMSDSTNSERKGCTQSERTVGGSFEKLFIESEGKRIIIASFSSNIHRVQQIIDCSVANGRKVAVFGRSMINVMGIAIELGYLKAPPGTIIDIDLMNKYPPEKIVLITTGSQGEPMSALTRMAMNDHKKVNITPLDVIIISATPIPGNEKLVTKVVNELMKSGATVVYEAMYEVHVSGHACQDEQKLIIALTKPKFFIPVHGEYKHLRRHADTAIEMGIPEKNIIIAENGNVIETDSVEMKITGQAPSGRVLVDGLGVGDVGSIVLRDRKHLAQDGLIIVVATIETESGTVLAGPDIVSRGFVYVRESEELMTTAKKLLTTTLQTCMDNETHEWNAIKTKLKDVLSDYIYLKTKRSPMILPVIMEV